MRKKIEWQWERLDDNTARAKIMGGWIVLHTGQTHAVGEFNKKTNVNVNNAESMVFVADRDHEWTIIPPHSEAQKPPLSGGLELFGKP